MSKIVIARNGKATGKCIPDRLVDTEEIIEKFRQNGVTTTPGGRPLTVAGIEDLLRVRMRRWADPDQNTSDLALIACNQALKRGGLSWQDMNVIALGSSSPESFFPSTACTVLSKVNGPRIGAVDLLAACTSGVYAFDYVFNKLANDIDCRYGMVVGAEILASRMTDWTNLDSNLWSDMAGALILEKVEDDGTDSGVICTITGSDPSMANSTRSIGKGTRPEDLYAKPNIFMKGHDIHRFILTIIPELVRATIEKANRIFQIQGKPPITIEDVDLFVIHQPNGRSFEKPAAELGIPQEKIFTNVHRYGNGSSAAVMVVYCEAVEEGLIRKGKLVLIISFGGGITWGSVLVRI